jgi:predicted GTPase
MSSKEDNTNLYRVLERGDRQVDAAHPKAILLVGLTRAGKSTTFNWTLGKHLIGVGDEVEAHYENVINQDVETAELGDTFTSVTLCPNVVEFNKERGITLIDMAGYRDKRDFIGVLGVSYFLKAVFEKVS